MAYGDFTFKSSVYPWHIVQAKKKQEYPNGLFNNRLDVSIKWKVV